MSKEMKPGFNSDADLITALVGELAKRDSASPQSTGACAYATVDGKAHCAELSKASCDVLKGFWDSTTHCTSGTPGPKQCRSS